jgi:hypothetical protein
LERVGDALLDELLARASTVFPPVFLPIFEHDGDLYAVHLIPGRPLQESAWVQLPHDAAEPRLVATSIKSLPAALVVFLLGVSKQLPEAKQLIKTLVATLPGSRSPDLKFLKPGLPWDQLLSRIDEGNGAARMAVALESCKSKEEAAKRVERVWREDPQDTYRLFVLARARARSKLGDAAGPAREVLSREVAWGFRHPAVWFIPPADSGPETLEHLRPLALEGLEEDHPFALLRETSYQDRKTAERLRKVAAAWRARGDERQALAQLRNGAAVVGVHGRLTRVWCERLAEQAERVEPGGLSARLAQHAAKVFHLGP